MKSMNLTSEDRRELLGQTAHVLLTHDNGTSCSGRAVEVSLSGELRLTFNHSKKSIALPLRHEKGLMVLSKPLARKLGNSRR